MRKTFKQFNNQNKSKSTQPLLGCVCSTSRGLPGAVQAAYNCGANTLMIYTALPTDTRRRTSELREEMINEFRVDRGLQMMKDYGIGDLIVHASHMIDLGSADRRRYDASRYTLMDEVERTEALGAKTLVLQLGNTISNSDNIDQGMIERYAKGLNFVLKDSSDDMVIALETTTTKINESSNSRGSESLEVIQRIINRVHPKSRGKVGICLDTCNLYGSGYDLFDPRGLYQNVISHVSADMIKVICVNDSANETGDISANIGEGRIGFTALAKIVWSDVFASVPKILKTPDRMYKTEISSLLKFKKYVV